MKQRPPSGPSAYWPASWPDLARHLPPGVQLRAGLDLSALAEPDAAAQQVGGGASSVDVQLLEISAAIAGEPISTAPAAVCGHVLAPFAGLLSDMNDEARPHLLPVSWALVGTASHAHVAPRLEILAEMALALARLQAPAFQRAAPDDERPAAALTAAEAYWAKPSAAGAERANSAFQTATEAAQRVMNADRVASLAAHGAAGAARMAHCAHIALAADADELRRMIGGVVRPHLIDQPGVLEGVRRRFAADAAENAAMATIAPEEIEGVFWRDDAAEMALRALRRAVEAGPHGAVPPSVAAERLSSAAFV